jgi:hypothetical protein
VATLTGLARVEDRKHYLGELAGAAIGILIGSEVVGSGSPGHWNLTPADRGMGLSLHF